MFMGGEVQQTIQTIGDAAPWDEALAFAKLVWKDYSAKWWFVPSLLILTGLWIWRRRR